LYQQTQIQRDAATAASTSAKFDASIDVFRDKLKANLGHVVAQLATEGQTQSAEKLQLVLEDLFGIDVDVPDSITSKTTEKWLKKVVPKVFFDYCIVLHEMGSAVMCFILNATTKFDNN
jgi:hypothetical protein